jgi:hypothetical protein
MQLREHGTNCLALVDDGVIDLKGGHLAASDDAVIERPLTPARVNKVVPVTRNGAGGSVTIERPRGVIRVGNAIVVDFLSGNERQRGTGYLQWVAFSFAWHS